MRKKITVAYVFLVSVIFSIAFTIRYYRIWSKIYSLLFVPKRLRKLQPLLRTNPDEALTRTLKVPYVPDGFKQLGDVSADVGVLESKIIAIEAGESFDKKSANDCDDYARHLSNSLDSSLHPYMASIICIDRRDLKAGIFPKFPGHCVCLWMDLDDGTIYHIGNWNSRPKKRKLANSREFGYSNFQKLAKDMAKQMAGNENDVLAWLIMDPDLRTCAWGMGIPPAFNALDIIDLKPTSLIG